MSWGQTGPALQSGVHIYFIIEVDLIIFDCSRVNKLHLPLTDVYWLPVCLEFPMTCVTQVIYGEENTCYLQPNYVGSKVQEEENVHTFVDLS